MNEYQEFWSVSCQLVQWVHPEALIQPQQLPDVSSSHISGRSLAILANTSANSFPLISEWFNTHSFIPDSISTDLEDGGRARYAYATLEEYLR